MIIQGRNPLRKSYNNSTVSITCKYQNTTHEVWAAWD